MEKKILGKKSKSFKKRKRYFGTCVNIPSGPTFSCQLLYNVSSIHLRLINYTFRYKPPVELIGLRSNSNLWCADSRALLEGLP